MNKGLTNADVVGHDSRVIDKDKRRFGTNYAGIFMYFPARIANLLLVKKDERGVYRTRLFTVSALYGYQDKSFFQLILLGVIIQRGFTRPG
jgi:hypothetical protein